jgi:arsenate reductase|tara:strand:+ start:825 stop:1172 length:348 start_codon:yes stop_codon:yes gene_type:complete
MTNTILYYNANCSKCRTTKALLDERNILPVIINYLNSPFTADDFSHITSLGIPAKNLIRTGEDEWKSTGLNIETASDDDLINAIFQHPILLQRPIVIANGKAVIARPPEKVLEIL